MNFINTPTIGRHQRAVRNALERERPEIARFVDPQAQPVGAQPAIDRDETQQEARGSIPADSDIKSMPSIFGQAETGVTLPRVSSCGNLNSPGCIGRHGARCKNWLCHSAGTRVAQRGQSRRRARQDYDGGNGKNIWKGRSRSQKSASSLLPASLKRRSQRTRSSIFLKCSRRPISRTLKSASKPPHGIKSGALCSTPSAAQRLIYMAAISSRAGAQPVSGREHRALVLYRSADLRRDWSAILLTCGALVLSSSLAIQARETAERLKRENADRKTFSFSEIGPKERIVFGAYAHALSTLPEGPDAMALRIHCEKLIPESTAKRFAEFFETCTPRQYAAITAWFDVNNLRHAKALHDRPGGGGITPTANRSGRRFDPAPRSTGGIEI